jgi:tRNA (guanine37-N1)-methyltransferase
MMEEERVTLAAKVPSHEGENYRVLLRKLGALDPSFAPFVEGEHLLIPIKDQGRIREDPSLRGLELVRRPMRVEPRRPRNVREALSRELEPGVASKIRRSFDVIGDIAIVAPDEVASLHKQLLVKSILSVHPNVRLILAKVSPVTGRERVATYERWYGTGPTETMHKEHGCVYSLDVTKVFFTPRLSTERRRVASLVGRSETVGDLFAGVGPFSVLIAKLQPISNVRACDISPEAVSYLRRNIRLNGVSDRVRAYLGDAEQVAREHLSGTCDRVVMNLPKEAELYLSAATRSLKPSGGIIHLYLFRREPQTIDEKILTVTAELKSLGWGQVKVLSKRQVREVGPREFNDVIDLSVSP